MRRKLFSWRTDVFRVSLFSDALLHEGDLIALLVEADFVHERAHQQDPSAAGLFEIGWVARVGQRCRIEAAAFVADDESRGFDPTTLPDPCNPANLEKASGRGILLMRSFMDEIIFNEQGNQVTLVKRGVTEEADAEDVSAPRK